MYVGVVKVECYTEVGIGIEIMTEVMEKREFE